METVSGGGDGRARGVPAEPFFLSPEAWLSAVEGALQDAEVLRSAAALAVSPQAVIKVARAEALGADPQGSSSIGLSDLAARSGVDRRLAARARVVLIEAGLMSLVTQPSNPGTASRTLHERNGS